MACGEVLWSRPENLSAGAESGSPMGLATYRLLLLQKALKAQGMLFIKAARLPLSPPDFLPPRLQPQITSAGFVFQERQSENPGLRAQGLSRVFSLARGRKIRPATTAEREKRYKFIQLTPKAPRPSGELQGSITCALQLRTVQPLRFSGCVSSAASTPTRPPLPDDGLMTVRLGADYDDAL